MRGCAWIVVATLSLAACAERQVPTPATAPARVVSPLHNPNALYQQIQKCLAETDLKPSCVQNEPEKGYVILKDISPVKPKAWLILPVEKVTGIEDPKILQPPVTQLWAYGWEAAQMYVKAPHDNTGLAINSEAGRSQNQLHIHISCVKKSVREALAANAAKIGDTWAAKPFVALADGHSYNAMKIATLQTSPFVLLARLPQAKADMKDQSLAVIGARGGGWYLLDDYTHAGEAAEAEELLDESCGS